MTDTPVEREEEEGTWARLRRRKVVQWGIAYAAGAWGFLQGLQYVSDAFGWPGQLRQVAILALLIGLPIVLVIAWYHGDRGEQRVSGTELAIITLLFVLGGGIFWRYERAGDRSPPATSDTAPPVTAPTPAATSADTRLSIAVLPFENRSAEPDDAFFVDGIHDDILTQLTKVSAMKVISRTSVARFRDTKLPMQSIAEQLGVTKILEGGVQRAGDRVRINVQLIDAASDAHLWAESYDRELTAAKIFAIQSEVATAIATALNATLTAAEKSRVNSVPTRNLEAWEAYQLGRQRMANRTTAGLTEAEKFFQRAIDLDPRFALAYVGLADTLAIRPERSNASPAIILARAAQAIDTALHLDPNLAEAWATSGLIAQGREQFDQAETMFRRAIALNPNYAIAYQWFGGMLSGQGRGDEGLGYLERALELDPLSAIINENLGTTLESFGRFDEAEARYRKVIEIDPTMAYPYLEMGLVEAYARNRFSVAVPLVEKSIELDPDNPSLRLNLAQLHLDLGNDDQATRVVESARARWPENEFVLTVAAIMAMLRGEEEAARRTLAKVVPQDPRNSYALALLDIVDLRLGNYDAARQRYAAGYPELVAAVNPKVDGSNLYAAVNIAHILQKTADMDRAALVLDRAEALVRSAPRLGTADYGIIEVEIDALRGQRREALSALRAAEREGWRGGNWPLRFYRDFDPNLASIRNDPDFKAVFADIELDMARQRAELAKRPRNAPLDLGPGN